MLENIIRNIKENKKFYLASLVAVGTGVIDCYLTYKGLKSGVGREGNFYYQNFIEFFGHRGIYLGKGLMLATLILMTKKESMIKKRNIIWPLNCVSVANAIGTGSWILSYYL